ncbi:hypothetical protein ACOBQX_25755 [Actinokineospora sp. G85]|uniref:hypothetical protein n=1 Tax=Actinokineospora sp. G85 TaxID=3406626 RepID=UPI003C74ADA1
MAAAFWRRRPWPVVEQVRPVLVLGAVAVVSVAMLSRAPRAPASAELLPPAVTPEVDADVALRTWLQGGGLQRMQAVVTEVHFYYAAVEAGELNLIVTACERSAAAVEAALPTPPPEREFHRHWSAALDATSAGALGCLLALPHEADPDVARQSTEDFNRAASAFLAAFTLITG